MANRSGLEYHLDKNPGRKYIQSPSIAAFSKKYGKQNEMEEALFDAYFTQGKISTMMRHCFNWPRV